MRSETEIKKMITDLAAADNRIKAVWLNGSRANPGIPPDKLQDYDIVFLVNDLESFTRNHDWTNPLGEKLIFQLPDEMTFGKQTHVQDEVTGFHYLMQFRDGVRIDLTLLPADRFKNNFTMDSLTVVWLDKDGMLPDIPNPTDKDYHISKPTEKEFSDTCNEFWWVSIYVARGLVRKEITYAKEKMEMQVRPMFMNMIKWKIGFENNFSVSFGQGGKFMSRYLDKHYYNKVLQTYANDEIENNWTALWIMTGLFEQTSTELASGLNYHINREEIRNTVGYLKQLHDESKKADP